MNDVVLNVYIIHSTVLLNRKKNVDKLLGPENQNWRYVVSSHTAGVSKKSLTFS